MPRRKPASSKQRKTELQLKRAVKRGDIPAPPPQPKPPRGQRARHPAGITRANAADPPSKRLQSAFLKVEPEFLEQSKLIAATAPLPRPLPSETAILDENEVGYNKGGQLTCPKRPKWRFDMLKKEVERNEEGVYQTWISETDRCVEAWRRAEPETALPTNTSDIPTSKVAPIDASPKVPRSPTYYERNLEVWRQLWRVSEISQIILLLLDSRCPALHFPPSLHTYLASLKPPRPLILVLTKSDLVPPSYTAAWTAWLRDRHPSARVVKVESYREQDVHEERKGQGQRKKFEPEMKPEDLRQLVEALKATHADLVTQPEKVRSDEEKLKKWVPWVPQAIDWEAALCGGRAKVDEPANEESQFLTIGLIGQPNVGKSSLLNALFGTHKVKASRTPGKTKHFQTLFWTPHIRLVDCPGLVMPNFVRMELQVLCGILPISQIPSIPACIHYALRLLPLELILCLVHSSNNTAILPDKRTWRGERPLSQQTGPVGSTAWTAMDVLTAFANNKGWVTAKAGRPDTNRAGNSLLRALAEGKIRWAFCPPSGPLSDQPQEGQGIWLGNIVEDEEDHSEVESNGTASSEEAVAEDTWGERGDEEEEEEGHEIDARVIGIGRFGALSLETEGEIENSGSLE